MNDDHKIDEVVDLVVRGRLQAMQDLVLHLDSLSRELRHEIEDLETITGSRPHVDRVTASLKAALVFERLRAINDVATHVATCFADEARKYEAQKTGDKIASEAEA
jgi:hypothetical protein